MMFYHIGYIKEKSSMSNLNSVLVFSIIILKAF